MKVELLGSLFGPTGVTGTSESGYRVAHRLACEKFFYRQLAILCVGRCLRADLTAPSVDSAENFDSRLAKRAPLALGAIIAD